MIRVRKNARYPVLLACGHDALVSPASYFAGSFCCKHCPGSWSARCTRIVRAYTLRNANCRWYRVCDSS